MTQYPDSVRAKTLAALEFNGGNVQKTAREANIPRSTVHFWRDQARAAGQAIPTRVPEQIDWADIKNQAGRPFLEMAGELLDIMRSNLEQFRDTKLKAGDLQHLAIALGITTDKALDILVGRKGMEINVDARQQSVRLSGDELKDALAELRMAREADDVREATVPAE